MKHIIAMFALIVLGTGVYAQGDAINKFFNKYSGDQSFTEAKVSSKMFSLFTNMEVENPDDKEVLEAISKLKGLRILGKENTSDARNLYKEASSAISGKEYEELMSVRDKDKDMKFFIRESGGKINELLMIMGGTKDFMVMSLFGEIDLKQISRIGRKMNVGGLEHLERMDKKN
jgi:hypothetical protein